MKIILKCIVKWKYLKYIVIVNILFFLFRKFKMFVVIMWEIVVVKSLFIEKEINYFTLYFIHEINP